MGAHAASGNTDGLYPADIWIFSSLEDLKA